MHTHTVKESADKLMVFKKKAGNSRLRTMNAVKGLIFRKEYTLYKRGIKTAVEVVSTFQNLSLN